MTGKERWPDNRGGGKERCPEKKGDRKRRAVVKKTAVKEGGHKQEWP